MKGFRQGLLAIGLSWSLIACASYEVRVDTYLAEGTSLREDASIAVVTNAEASNPILEAEVKAKLGRLLTARGIQPGPEETAQFGLMASYSISDPQMASVAAPTWQPGGTFLTTTGGTSGSLYSTIHVPVYSTWSSSTVTRYTASLSLMLFDLESFRQSGQVDPKWIGNARTTSESSDLRTLVNYLLVPLVDLIGQDTSRQISIEMRAKDARVGELTGE